MTDIPERFAEYIAGLRSSESKLHMQRYPGLSERPWYDTSGFAFARELEAHADEIRHEFHLLNHSAFHREAEGIDRVGSWDVLMLYDAGRRHDEICRRCPVTTRIVETNGAGNSLIGLAYFSRLAPKTRIAPHRAATNMRLRCHLAIEVPDKCGIMVGSITRTWTPGKCLIFDDSLIHSAWNDSSEQRTVLVADLEHPELTADEIIMLRGLHDYVKSYAMGMSKYWAANDAARSSPDLTPSHFGSFERIRRRARSII
jgi:aspartyl/asparaginyl beta-hydroxylase (cupin superfamily)